MLVSSRIFVMLVWISFPAGVQTVAGFQIGVWRLAQGPTRSSVFFLAGASVQKFQMRVALFFLNTCFLFLDNLVPSSGFLYAL